MRFVTIDFICTYFTSLHWNIYDSDRVLTVTIYYIIITIIIIIILLI